MAIPDTQLFIFLALFLAAAMSLLLRYRERCALTAHGTLVALGDSITYGQGIPVEDNFVSLLSRRLKTLIINAGVPGDTTADVLARLDRDVLSLTPNAVIVFLGGNDFLWPLLMRQNDFRTQAQILRGSRDFEEIPIEKTFENLRTIIDRVHAAGAKVVLVGFSTEFLDSFGEEFAKIAREKQVAAYVPNALSGVLFSKKHLVSETVPRVHPNSAGHKLIADRIQPALEKVLKSG